MIGINKKEKKYVVISAINFFEGGPLSVLTDCLNSIVKNKYLDYIFVILVHKSSLFLSFNNIENIEFVEFPKSRSSYFYRLYYEFFYFYKISNKQPVYLWFSFHDITPNVVAQKRVVYCHNPIPFLSMDIKGYLIQPKLLIFKFLYSLAYRINLKKNTFVIVQQEWIRKKFIENYNLDKSKILVSLPSLSKYLNSEVNNFVIRNDCKMFFYPTFPRSFKNIELICKAVEFLEKNGTYNFEVIITISGDENNYSKYILGRYKHLKSINFVGLIDRETVFNYYSKIDVLLFPSLIETWGLPLSEIKDFKKTIFVSDRPYAKETIGDYKYVKYFDPFDYIQLANLMFEYINDKILFYDSGESCLYAEPFVDNWEKLLNKVLK